MEVHLDEMMDRFKVGDVVRFNLEEKDIYSFPVPKTGTIGLIEVQTYSFGLEDMLGVQIPMSVVQWADGNKSAVFSHDINKLEADEKVLSDITNKLKNITPYTGETIN